uniref:HDC17117 n=1 Tax=Drosophila melanogaster TaxID=7227 RepID=Q6IIT7_DROME|nr:TPA_inf: HDC17117 [Drosophila melanogaster]
MSVYSFAVSYSSSYCSLWPDDSFQPISGEDINIRTSLGRFSRSTLAGVPESLNHSLGTTKAGKEVRWLPGHCYCDSLPVSIPPQSALFAVCCPGLSSQSIYPLPTASLQRGRCHCHGPPMSPLIRLVLMWWDGELGRNICLCTTVFVSVQTTASCSKGDQEDDDVDGTRLGLGLRLGMGMGMRTMTMTAMMVMMLLDDLVLRPAACCIPLAHLLPMATEMCVLKLQVDLANDGLWRL